MKLKSVLKYELSTTGISVIIFLGVILAIRVLGIAIMYISGSESLHMSAMETNSILFMLILGSLTFFEDFRFLIQNGYSRKSMLAGFVIIFLIVAFGAALYDVMMGALLSRLFDYESLFYQIYGAASALRQWLWFGCLNFVLCMISFSCTVLFFRLDKKQRLIFLCALPVLLITSAVMLVIAFVPMGLLAQIGEVLLTMLGVFPEVNVLYPILLFGSMAALFVAIAYMLVRKVSLYL